MPKDSVDKAVSYLAKKPRMLTDEPAPAMPIRPKKNKGREKGKAKPFVGGSDGTNY